MTEISATGLVCPLPESDTETIQLAHGGGGRMMDRLLEDIIRPIFDNEQLQRRHDGAVLDVDDSQPLVRQDRLLAGEHAAPVRPSMPLQARQLEGRLAQTGEIALDLEDAQDRAHARRPYQRCRRGRGATVELE